MNSGGFWGNKIELVVIFIKCFVNLRQKKSVFKISRYDFVWLAYYEPKVRASFEERIFVREFDVL